MFVTNPEGIIDDRNHTPFRFGRNGIMKRIKTYPPWYRYRGYLHFDQPVNLVNATKIVTNPRSISTHAFYPFITYEILTKKIIYDPTKACFNKIPKIRPIAYASHIDSHIYSYYAFILNCKYEEYVLNNKIGSNVLAFRRLGKSNINFANEAFDEIIKMGNCVALTFDITKFFDSLKHEKLKEVWCRILETERLPDDHYNVYKSLIQFSKVKRDEIFKAFNISKNNPKNNKKRICTPKEFRDKVRLGNLIVKKQKEGIPQGSPISALLSNMYMIDFDVRVKAFIDNLKGKYFRYCDDILCIAPVSEEMLIDKVIEEIEKSIEINVKLLELELNDKKTEKRKFKIVNGSLQSDKPLQYLGFTFYGQRKIIRSAAFARYSERMKTGVALSKLTRDKYNKIRIQKGLKVVPLYKMKLYERYSHLGERNFIIYALRCAEIMKSKAIRNQVKPLWQRLQDEIKK